MEKNSTLIFWLVAFAAIVTLITKIVELMSALLKYRSEKKKPTEHAIASAAIHPTVRHSRALAFILLSDVVVIPFAVLALLAMSQKQSPATVSDVVQIVICASAIIISGHRLSPSA